MNLEGRTTLLTLTTHTPASFVGPSPSAYAVASLLQSLRISSTTTEEWNDIWPAFLNDSPRDLLGRSDSLIVGSDYDLANVTSNSSSGVNNATTLLEDDATLELITIIATAIVLGLIILATVIGEYRSQYIRKIMYRSGCENSPNFTTMRC